MGFSPSSIQMKGASYAVMNRMVAPPGGRIKMKKMKNTSKIALKTQTCSYLSFRMRQERNSKTYTRTFGTSISVDPSVSLPGKTGSGKFNMATAKPEVVITFVW